MPEASRRRNAAFGSDNSPLITDARRRKFDLLVHLVLNLAEPIALIGPRGIGKSTYLGQLSDATTAFGIPCAIQCNETTSYEQILDEIRWALEFEAGDKSNQELDLTELLAVCLKRKRLVVVMLDDAGRLLPGMANALWTFACGHPGLRLVFAMRSEEYARASLADGIAFRSARPLEIPPLTLGESRQYISELLAVHRRDLSTQRVSSRFVDTLYRRTGGVPGQIHEQLLQEQPIPNRLAGVSPVVAIAGGAALAIAGLASVWMLNSGQPGSQAPVPVVEAPPPVAARPIPAPPSQSAAQVPDPANPAPTAPVAPLPTEAPIPEAGVAAIPVKTQPAVPEVEPIPPVKPIEPAPAPMTREELLALAAMLLQPPVQPAELLPDYLPPPPPPPPPSETPVVSPAQPEAVQQADAVAEAARPAAPSVEETKDPSAVATSLDVAASNPAASAPPDAAESAATPEWASLGVPLEGFKDAGWLMRQPADGVVVQLVALGRPELIEQLAHALPPDAVRATFRSRKGKNNLYPLLIGPYPGPTEAAQALGALPGKWPGAFLRPVNSVQQEIQRLRPSSTPRPAAVAPKPKPKPKVIPPKPKPPQPPVRPRPAARPAAPAPEPPATVEP